MTYLIGLHGVAGAGKDTVFERLRELGGTRYRRSSVADPLKESVAALFGITVEELEVLKRDDEAKVKLTAPLAWVEREFTMREFLQHYGTRSHRGVFGKDFWLDIWLDKIESMRAGDGALRTGDGALRTGGPYTYVNTSVRFENEAQAILDRGGEIWLIEGPQDDGAEGHESEERLPAEFITRTIDNSLREEIALPRVAHITGGQYTGMPNYEYLDDQVIEAIHS